MDWFANKSQKTRQELKRLLGPTGHRSKDFTAKSWMDALSFSLTRILRHGDRGPDARGHARVYGMLDLDWEGDASLSVHQVADQPTFRLLGATEDDIINYVKAMEESTSLDISDKRFALVRTEGGARVKAN